MESTEAIVEILSNISMITDMNPVMMDEILKAVVERYKGILQIYVMDESGMQIYKTSGELGDRSDREYFIDALKGNGNFSSVIISGTTGKPIIVRAEPIYSQNEIVGVVLAHPDETLISEKVNFSDLKPV